MRPWRRATRAASATANSGGPVGGQFTPRRRAATTIVDQGFSSVSNFAVGVAVARVAGASGLGAYSLAYACWQVLAAMHRSLITDPMAIEGDVYNVEGHAHTDQVRNGIRSGLGAELILGLGGMVFFGLLSLLLLAFGQRTFAIGMAAMAPWVPVLLVQDYWRWVGFMTRRPQHALANDTVFNLVQGMALAAVFITHIHSVVALIASWGLGALVGALYGLRQHHIRPSFSGGAAMLRGRWSMSKWLAGTSLSGSAGTQLSVFIAGVILGPVGLGEFRAAQTLVVGPAGVLIMAGGSIGLPEASKAYTEKGLDGLIRVARIVTIAGLCSFLGGAVLIAAFGKTLLTTIYGPSFGNLELAAVLMAIAYIVFSFCLGPTLVLKATRNTRPLFHLHFLMLIVSLTSLAALAVVWGVNGAAASLIVTFLVGAVSMRWVQHRLLRGDYPEEVNSHVLDPLQGPSRPEPGVEPVF
jgi:O-antigen/teichoic acid export membrane protein